MPCHYDRALNACIKVLKLEREGGQNISKLCYPIKKQTSQVTVKRI
jgi:hypothetical protein